MDEEEVSQRISKLALIVARFWKTRLSKESIESVNREVYATLYTNRNFFEIDSIFPLKKYSF
jgi:hypothetical protein